MAIYRVIEQGQNGDKAKEHLVKAKTAAQALRAVVEPRFTVESATTEQAIALTAAGAKLIEA